MAARLWIEKAPGESFAWVQIIIGIGLTGKMEWLSVISQSGTLVRRSARVSTRFTGLETTVPNACHWPTGCGSSASEQPMSKGAHFCSDFLASKFSPEWAMWQAINLKPGMAALVPRSCQRRNEVSGKCSEINDGFKAECGARHPSGTIKRGPRKSRFRGVHTGNPEQVALRGGTARGFLTVCHFGDN
jgi:hypothetical protein